MHHLLERCIRTVTYCITNAFVMEMLLGGGTGVSSLDPIHVQSQHSL